MSLILGKNCDEYRGDEWCELLSNVQSLQQGLSTICMYHTYISLHCGM